jgi:hypothetical protein
MEEDLPIHLFIFYNIWSISFLIILSIIDRRVIRNNYFDKIYQGFVLSMVISFVLLYLVMNKEKLKFMLR